jgi:hypothetical protein
VAVLGYIASVVTLLLIPSVSAGGYLIPFGIVLVLGMVALVLSFLAKTPTKATQSDTDANISEVK